MGCDIHGVMEVDYFGDQTYWSGVVNLGVLDRYYGMFANLAGVRDYGEADPIAPDRGMPDNPSHMTKVAYEEWAEDAHSLTYLTVDEFFKADLLGIEDNKWMKGWKAVYEMAKALSEIYGNENVRLIIWFDS